MSRAPPVEACQCVGNTLGIPLWKRVSLRIDQCLTFKFVHCVNNCVIFTPATVLFPVLTGASAFTQVKYDRNCLDHHLR